MNVLRMIKLFGWEKRARENVAEKRDEELKWIWKRALCTLVNNNVKYAFPCQLAVYMRRTHGDISAAMSFRCCIWS